MSKPAARVASPDLDAAAFPAATPLNVFFTWNEPRPLRDRRYRIASDLWWLIRGFGRETAISHLADRPMLRRRWPWRVVASARTPRRGGRRAGAARAAAEHIVDALILAVGSADTGAHAAVFAAFDDLARHIDVAALARPRPRHRPAVQSARPQQILIVKLGALGDLVQALGPVPDIRRHHPGARLSLLTTGPYAEFARRSSLFDEVLIDRRPRGADIGGWLALVRLLRQPRFDRVYDFQTRERTGLYAFLMRRRGGPEWSGTAWRCSHPHANPARNRLHTLDRQREQLLMAGVHPVSTLPLPPPPGPLPAEIEGRRFALLIPGSSPRRPQKRWPAARYGALASRLERNGYRPVVVGAAGEERLASAICEICPAALDLVGHTDLLALGALARAAALTVGNDTGATHLAAAGGNPVVVLFSGASDPNLCAPRGRCVRVLQSPELADLPVETVFAAAIDLAAAAEGAGRS